MSFEDFIKSQNSIKPLKERLLEETPLNAEITSTMVNKYYNVVSSRYALESLVQSGHFIISKSYKSGNREFKIYKRVNL